MNNSSGSLRLSLNSVKVENCVLSRQTRVAEGATLKDCESRPGAEVIAKGAREEYMPRSSDPEGLQLHTVVFVWMGRKI
jgi:hypothetical protein